MTTPTLPVTPVGGNQENETTWGSHNICPLLTQFQIMEITWLGSICHFPGRGMGRLQEAQIWHDLSLPSASSGGRGGEEIWASGCMGPSMSIPSPLSGRGREKAGPTHLHKRGLALHLCMVMLRILSMSPSPTMGTLASCIDGTPSRGTCGCLGQLEVHQLLQLETQMVYPEGLNGCLVPVVTMVPGSLAHAVPMHLMMRPSFCRWTSYGSQEKNASQRP